jgi:hypothetical protein
MRVLFTLFVLGYCAMSAVAQIADSPRKMQIGAAIHILGHNYFGFWTEEQRGAVSFNGICRYVITEHLSSTASIGWGMYNASSYRQGQGFSENKVHYIPGRLGVQVGYKQHFLDLGFSVTTAFGEQLFKYRGSGSASSVDIEYLVKTRAVQSIPSIGYSFFGKRGLSFGVSFTPHFFPKQYERYNDYYLEKPFWLPVGFHVGWFFRK